MSTQRRIQFGAKALGVQPLPPSCDYTKFGWFVWETMRTVKRDHPYLHGALTGEICECEDAAKKMHYFLSGFSAPRLRTSRFDWDLPLISVSISYLRELDASVAKNVAFTKASFDKNRQAYVNSLLEAAKNAREEFIEVAAEAAAEAGDKTAAADTKTTLSLDDAKTVWDDTLSQVVFEDPFESEDLRSLFHTDMSSLRDYFDKLIDDGYKASTSTPVAASASSAPKKRYLIAPASTKDDDSDDDEDLFDLDLLQAAPETRPANFSKLQHAALAAYIDRKEVENRLFAALINGRWVSFLRNLQQLLPIPQSEFIGQEFYAQAYQTVQQTWFTIIGIILSHDSHSSLRRSYRTLAPKAAWTRLHHDFAGPDLNARWTHWMSEMASDRFQFRAADLDTLVSTETFFDTFSMFQQQLLQIIREQKQLGLTPSHKIGRAHV